uniref:IkappaB kinase n=1 Tax=Timema cristinae TaxID=61476 RepID=A0A7R9CLP0_TIMCR|nr:unnamed protein product [Timema cristinae]
MMQEEITMSRKEPMKIGEWARLRVLGSGGFGVETFHFSTALKKCHTGTDALLSEKHKERWAKEVEIMLRLSHPNIVKAITVPEAFLPLQSSSIPILCMEFCSKGDLRQASQYTLLILILNRAENCCGLPESDVRAVINDAKSAIQYLHQNRITHRDLKPENIVLQVNDEKVSYKLIDLGYAKELDQSSLCSSFVGTLQYLAPELFTSKTYTSSVDYWSLGLLSHEVITGVRPFLPHMPPVSWVIQTYKGRTIKEERNLLQQWGRGEMLEEARPGFVVKEKRRDGRKKRDQENGVMLYVYRKSMLKMPDVTPKIPPFVINMLEDPQSKMEYQYQKRVWAQSVFFFKQEVKLYQTFVKANMVKLVEESLRVYDNLRRKAKDKHNLETTSNLEMVKILYKFLKIRDKVLQDRSFTVQLEVLETLQKDLDDVGTHVSMKEEKINQLYLEMKNYIIARKHNTWALAATLMNNESSTQLEDVTSIIKDNFDLRHFRPNTRHAHRDRARGREKMEWKRGDKQRLGGIAVTLGAAIKSREPSRRLNRKLH